MSLQPDTAAGPWGHHCDSGKQVVCFLVHVYCSPEMQPLQVTVTFYLEKTMQLKHSLSRIFKLGFFSGIRIDKV